MACICFDIFICHDHKGSVAPLYLATLMYITGRYHPCLNVMIEYNKRLKNGVCTAIFSTSVSESLVRINSSVLRNALKSAIDLHLYRKVQNWALIIWHVSVSISSYKTLLQSLSHSQFMCYGLLKIYLTEVLGSFEEINDLVSSYFIKTVLLWKIQTNSQHNVGVDSLLHLFRNCLLRL
jgi:hypothetical protein